jgi:hypothetical protein
MARKPIPKIIFEVKPETIKQAIHILNHRVKKGVFRGLVEGMLYAQTEAQNRFDTPGNLHNRTWLLSQSIETKVYDTGTEMVGVLGSGTKSGRGVIYANVHEFGYPPRNIPARPYIRPSLFDNLSEINKLIMESINIEVNK